MPQRAILMLRKFNKTSTLNELLEWTNGIDCIYNPVIYGLNNISILGLVYAGQKNINIEAIRISKSLDHTMLEALDEYVKQKLPVQFFKSALMNKKPIEIHGAYPQHIKNKKIQKVIGISKKLTFLKFNHNPNDKYYNYIRPIFAQDTEKAYVFVGPGKDYLKHYSSLIFYLLDTVTTRWGDTTKIFYYPHVENSIHVWSSLNDKIAKNGDLVILGYVTELLEFLKSRDKNLTVREYENEYYKSHRILVGRKTINLLGVKFSFWGNLSAKIVNRLCQLGISELIYFGKLGTLQHPKDIYAKLYSPTKYSVIYHDKLVCVINDLENKLVRKFPELNSGMHTSTPTVLEEDFAQRKILNLLNSKSIDNEISQMAYTIKKFNQDIGKPVYFSCIHFPTDYLRQLEKPDMTAGHNLSNNRTQEVTGKKHAIIKKACDYIYAYLKEGKNV